MARIQSIWDAFIGFFYSVFKPRFILFHAVYIIFLVIVGSIMIYPQGNIRYIDALFFAAGAATQSGLNTVDVNDLTTWQQVALFIIPAFSNPISINSFLVFVRLYWFEKAFENIAHRARLDHRLRKARTYAVGEDDIEHNGVGNRAITVLHSMKMTESNFPGFPFGFHKNKQKMEDEDDDDDDDERDERAMMFHLQQTGGLGPLTEKKKESIDGANNVISGDGALDNSESSKNRISSSSSYSSSSSPLSSVGKIRRTASPIKPLDAAQIAANRDIRFADVPSPRGRRLLLANESPYSSYNDNGNDIGLDNGPALVIKSPREQELEEQQAELEARRHQIRELDFAIGDKHHKPQWRVRSLSFSGDAAEPEHDNTDEPSPIYRTRSHVVARQADPNMVQQGHKVNKRAITIEAPGRTDKPKKPRNSFSNYFNPPNAMERLGTKISRTFTRRRDQSPRSITSRRSLGMLPYLSYEPTVARNSTFVGLTDDQRAELGGVEYRALRLLAIILCCYFFGFLLLGIVCFIPWIMETSRYRAIVESYAQRPAWWGAFMAGSTFMDVGFSIVPTSMMQFQTAVFPLLIMCFLIVIGNTGFPCMLRLIIWILCKIFPDGGSTNESLAFLLDHPRRCFTLLFPSGPTWWLFAVLVILNGADLILFVILDINNLVLDGWSAGQKVLDGLFQAFSTRTAGLTVVDLSQLHPAVQVSYMIMMYISVMPIAISVRRTNVYEEQSLGIYVSPDEYQEDEEEFEFTEEENRDEHSESILENGHGEVRHRAPSSVLTHDHDDPEKRMQRKMSTRRLSAITNNTKERIKKRKQRSHPSFVTNHLRRQLSFDLWYIFLGLFVICIADGSQISDTSNPSFNIFSVLFEVVSAYGTVGLSLGYPNTTTSFSAQFSVISKLVIIAMMLRGRHRGLPYALDRAILLPSESLAKKDLKQEIRVERKFSISSNADRPGTIPRTSTYGRSSAIEPITGT
ncbi:cation transport protein-domain-containing protein [Lipomyces japonicus]|uniref:cation transport protein-domain-containing protein n=1 Tax=Lipomyces japonicus TaxID=56871 RepID=UPI0034CDAF75